MSEEPRISVGFGQRLTRDEFMRKIKNSVECGYCTATALCKFLEWNVFTLRNFISHHDMAPVSYYVRIVRTKMLIEMAVKGYQLKEAAWVVSMQPDNASKLLISETGFNYSETRDAAEPKKYDPDPFAGACWSVNRRDARF